MSSPNVVSMEEILLEDDERDSIEYKILLAYAQQRLSVSKYGKLLENEANAQKPSSSIRRQGKTDHRRDTDRSSLIAFFQGPVIQLQGKTQQKTKYLPGHRLRFPCSSAEPPALSLQGGHIARFSHSENQSKILPQGDSQHQTSETADVNHIADKLAKLVTSRSQEPPSDVSSKISDLTDGSESEERDEEQIIQTIVSLLKQSGDQLEEQVKKDSGLYQHFKNMLSYTFFERITDLFLEDVSADSTSEPEGQVQCKKVAYTMEVATRLTAVDNHPMNLVLGFGAKYLREHFRPWIQDQGGWEKALTSLDQEEVE
ncbi:apoptosis facilitator Bcl-2-like protein 14 [Pezoporus wallicus]|uniref:apoptosis facilitator Bcl-2-like protein 14 n=1 Tax=Pezoporus wallicus TaxID=35540 RepID=UPI00254DCAB9|nr:apoptosis facilitator Bcl-2-like protein 14 [Pezoporus wallicus]XP_061332389.1 apoptosis facilitator Bcl-2-like protein 14 [Pezoporus flaviventris]XP_061332390.1 apoptosis facilitator Bcl-2-like protein 14 [Pezoporus flaviventris]